MSGISFLSCSQYSVSLTVNYYPVFFLTTITITRDKHSGHSLELD